MVSANRIVPDTVFNPLLFLARTVFVFANRRRRHALHVFVTLHVAGQQRRSHLGYKTIRQVSIAIN